MATFVLSRIVRIAVVAAAAVAPAAGAQTYPYKPIRFVVPYAPGGAADISARVVAPRLAEALGQQVVVDNRPGAGSIIGTEILARSPADGYTLMMANISFSANPALHAKLPYATPGDFAPVGMIDVMPNVLLVHPGVAARSVDELIALARAKPGQINYASAGIGSANHLNAELFQTETGVSIVNVPYQGGGQAIGALVGRQVQMLFITVPPALGHVQAGRARALAVTSLERLAQFPDVPTIAETVKPGFEFHEWHGVLAPAGTPAAIVTRLSTELGKITALPDVQSRIQAMGAMVHGSTPEQMADYIRTQMMRWQKSLKRIER